MKTHISYHTKMRQLHSRYVKLKTASTISGLIGFASFVAVVGIMGAVETDTMSLAASLKPSCIGLGLLIGSTGACKKLELAYRDTWRRMKRLASDREAALIARGAAHKEYA